MRSLLLLAALSLAACDASAPEPLADVAAGDYRIEIDGDLFVVQSGPAVYKVNPDRIPAANLFGASGLWATITLRAQRPGGQVGQLSFYAGDDRPVPLEPGTYPLSNFGSPFLLRFDGSQRSFTPYQGTLTIERATETEIVGSFDALLTTGGDGWFGSAQTAEGRGRFHALRQP